MSDWSDGVDSAMTSNTNSFNWLGLLGKGLGGVADYTATSNRADNAKAIADRTWNAGQTFRDRAAAAMTPGFNVTDIPGLSSGMTAATDSYLRKMSATHGNAAGIGAAPAQTSAFVLGNIAMPAWQNYAKSNAVAGGILNADGSAGLSADSTGAASKAATAEAGVYGSLGQTARNIFDPQPDLRDRYLNLLMKMYGLTKR